MSNEKFEKGLAIRKQVLGEEYVNNSINNADDFNLAMISALNRPHELKLHVKGALRNGVPKEKIREVLLQVAIYCGVPAAVDSFRIAKEAIREFESDETN